jgi:hypothetical protein
MTLIMGLNALEKNVQGAYIVDGITRYLLFIFIIIDQIVYFHANRLFVENKMHLNPPSPKNRLKELIIGTFVMLLALA